MHDELAFSRTLSAKERKIHLVAQKLNVYHSGYSVGEGEERYAVVTRIGPQRQQQTIQRQTSHTLSRAPSAYISASAQATTTVPPVPVLALNLNTATDVSGSANVSNGNIAVSSELLSPSGVVRQPHGPGIGGFGTKLSFPLSHWS
ncbi:hypothetical protein M378DRAFT_180371 [Amanita muscaria Koide BX008]|uniref:R3H domain-containing protein n=1 Tax=Amanita muscaria (strain Koide BX008) TaxID=946122 RepID=A0A0C2WWC5_AMAMK|nr:hypothetical protein M378DRAFT_180371 [Amanita muscaria Koide BX008]